MISKLKVGDKYFAVAAMNDEGKVQVVLSFGLIPNKTILYNTPTKRNGGISNVPKCNVHLPRNWTRLIL